MRDLKQTLQSSVERGEMTIPQFMEKQRMEGGVDLQGGDEASSASHILTTEQGRRYKLGQIVASGGMGAILDAKDVNVRRSVAMKVLLDPEEASQEDVLRFIEEAQVTGQLQHPSIVPLYELGVDAGGNVFYTMKFVQGQTLKAILRSIREGDKKVIEEYPLSRLLNIFQRICDAIAFAHSKRVIHRDLKPENVMVGEYGEVLVMDWGLAKVLAKKKRKKVVVKGRQPAGKKHEVQNGIDSIRKDASGDLLKTMDGEVMGTPGFMAPEQALGETENLDERSDIYALGAILYNILTLNPPVTGKNVDEILAKATTGDIPHPSEFNPGSRGKGRVVPLNHCPGCQIPDSLSAVAMKALVLEQAKRYQSVKFLQRDIDKYQSGFATSAEGAGAWRQMKLFVGRHKGATVAIATIAILLIGGSWLNTVERIKAVRERDRAEQKEKEAKKALKDLEGTAPALIAQADTFCKLQMYDKALETINDAVEYAPGRADYRLRQAHLLQATLELKAAEETYGKVLELKSADKEAKKNKELCQMLLTENQGKEITPETVRKLFLALREQNRFRDAMATSQRITGDERTREAFWKDFLTKQGVKFRGLTLDDDGRLLELDLNGTGIADLTPLKGIPFTSLNLLKTQVRDLSPLKGMYLTNLDLHSTLVNDLSPLKGMPLTSLNISFCRNIRNLTPLKGMPLTILGLFHSDNVKDLTPLKGMKLQIINLSETPVSDLSPLEGMPLTRFIFTPKRIVSGIDDIRKMTTIETIGV
jgi:serine/threonine protein kinase